jgi:hypothetical protein
MGACSNSDANFRMPLSPKMATSNPFLRFGKKIYKTKPALPNNPSYPLAFLHEHKLSQ